MSGIAEILLNLVIKFQDLIMPHTITSRLQNLDQCL